MKNIVNNLNGYLYALRRLTANQCDFWAELISVKSDAREDVEKAFEQYLADFEPDTRIKSVAVIDCDAVENLLESYIFNHLCVNDEALISAMAWDIIEYYGLASMRVDQDASFNPLVTQGALQVEVVSENYVSQVYYLVTIGHQVIVTALAKRDS